MFHFSIVYFSFLVDIEVVYLNFVYDYFTRLGLILNNAVFSIMINLVTVIIYRFFEYDVLFELN